MKQYFYSKQAADFSGYSIATLRRYEWMGKLTPKRNKENNYRMYSKEQLLKLRKAKREQSR